MTDTLPDMTFRCDAHVGMVEESAVIAVHDLTDGGVLCLRGAAWEAALVVGDQGRLRPYRRLLMGREPAVAQLLYDAGRNWAALTLIAEKKWAKALESVGPIGASAIPK
jgi:hypothetical protein